jgi:hypothetical protein
LSVVERQKEISWLSRMTPLSLRRKSKKGSNCKLRPGKVHF